MHNYTDFKNIFQKTFKFFREIFFGNSDIWIRAISCPQVPTLWVTALKSLNSSTDPLEIQTFRGRCYDPIRSVPVINPTF